LKKEANEFTTADGKLLKGFNITLLREDLQVRRHWVGDDQLKKMGFKDDMVADLFDPKSEGYALTVVNFDEKPGFGNKPAKIVPTSFRPA